MSFYYLSTPYTLYPEGREFAYKEAARQKSFLMKNDWKVFCPITHTHGCGEYGDVGFDVTDGNKWLEDDMPFMEASKGIVVCMMDSWLQSYGMFEEIKYFVDHDKPVYYMHPYHIPEASGYDSKLVLELMRKTQNIS